MSAGDTDHLVAKIFNQNRQVDRNKCLVWKRATWDRSDTSALLLAAVPAAARKNVDAA
jgi:hypothetical protein